MNLNNVQIARQDKEYKNLLGKVQEYFSFYDLFVTTLCFITKPVKEGPSRGTRYNLPYTHIYDKHGSVDEVLIFISTNNKVDYENYNKFIEDDIPDSIGVKECERILVDNDLNYPNSAYLRFTLENFKDITNE